MLTNHYECRREDQRDSTAGIKAQTDRVCCCISLAEKFSHVLGSVHTVSLNGQKAFNALPTILIPHENKFSAPFCHPISAFCVSNLTKVAAFLLSHISRDLISTWVCVFCSVSYTGDRLRKSRVKLEVQLCLLLFETGYIYLSWWYGCGSMKGPFSCLFLFLWFSCSIFGAYALNPDGSTLLSLVRHWETVPRDIKFSWNASHSTPCSWLGVHCDLHNFVTDLNLFGFGISGQLGPEIGYLNHLRSINLSSNFFSGSIPSDLGNCSLLKILELSGNSFSGDIPQSIGKLRNLEYLSLWLNSLTGTIPESLFRIPFLNTVYLNNNSLIGPIPSVVGNMSQLQYLYMNDNQLSGTIPSSIGNCSALQFLYLCNNSLVGSLPDTLSNLEHLLEFYANNNRLEGKIPLGFGNCKELQTLVLSNNQFTGGIPPDLGNCTSLISFAAINCGLTGQIPSSFGQLTNLTLLYLSENNLSGPIPPELGNCEAMVDLEMYGNQLEGGIPFELGKLRNLETLMLFTNHLTGEIPMAIWKIQSLRDLMVYENNLVGEIPEEITELKHLEQILLFDNQFTGMVPQGLGMGCNLTVVDFTRNKFTGPIPPNLCFRNQLKKLILGQNNFQGSISSDIGSCFTLTRLILKQNNLSGMLPEFVENPNTLFMDLSNNSISGPLPSSLENLANITYIDLSLNKLTGLIPPEIGRLWNLEGLNLSHNRLEGVLPSQLSSCHKLSKLDLSYNLLNGAIPSNLGSLTELSILDLRENQFTGAIQTSLFQLGKLSNLQLGGNLLSGNIPPSIGLEIGAQSLRFLNFSSNGLTGPVPLELARLKMLEQLDICCNNLSGSLETFSNLYSLTELNVSYNLFSGPLPPVLMKLLRSSPSSFIGNSGLCVNCGTDGGVGCPSNSPLQSCNMQSRKRHLTHVDIAMIGSGSALFAVILLLGISYIFFRHKGDKGNLLVTAEEGASSLLNQVMGATENLNDKYLIGRGAHGKVYKVTLGPNKVYALKKVAFVGFNGGNTSMIREINTIGKVRHRNVVRLEDFWLRKEYGLLLYSYMKNGSLHDVLHEKHPPLLLEWNVRYKIALGTAQGLSYLHFDCVPAIIHRDIKPTNILLDSDMEPHISDFGIAKLLDESVASAPSSTVQGTIGYMAPENVFSTKNSMEADVYAYGVVLLELITRKRTLDPSFGGEEDIVGWVRSVWSGNENIDMIVDPMVVDEFIDSGIKEQVEVALILALRCTENDAKKRPSMRDVVKQLTLLSNSRNRGKYT